jgi:prepilin signal peptidase PulO-like enzyme (type II secretory pathway)
MTGVALATSVVAPLASMVAGAIDARTGLIPNRVTYPALLVAVCLASAAGSLLDAIAGAACAGATLLALHLVTRGRGLGLGDVKLAICIGASLGAPAAMLALGAAFVAGGFAAALLLATGRAARGDTLCFGPYIALGSLVAFAARWSLTQ